MSDENWKTDSIDERIAELLKPIQDLYGAQMAEESVRRWLDRVEETRSGRDAPFSRGTSIPFPAPSSDQDGWRILGYGETHLDANFYSAAWDVRPSPGWLRSNPSAPTSATPGLTPAPQPEGWARYVGVDWGFPFSTPVLRFLPALQPEQVSMGRLTPTLADDDTPTKLCPNCRVPHPFAVFHGTTYIACPEVPLGYVIPTSLFREPQPQVDPLRAAIKEYTDAAVRYLNALPSPQVIYDPKYFDAGFDVNVRGATDMRADPSQIIMDDIDDPAETWQCTNHAPGLEITYPVTVEACEVCFAPKP